MKAIEETEEWYWVRLILMSMAIQKLHQAC